MKVIKIKNVGWLGGVLNFDTKTNVTPDWLNLSTRYQVFFNINMRMYYCVTKYYLFVANDDFGSPINSRRYIIGPQTRNFLLKKFDKNRVTFNETKIPSNLKHVMFYGKRKNI